VLVDCDAIVAAGLIVTLTLNTAPVQVPAPDFGVTVYIAVTALAVVLVRVAALVIVLLFVPAVAPEKPVPPGAAHVYVVLAGIRPPVTG